MYADFEFYAIEYDPNTGFTKEDINTYLVRANMYLEELFLRPPKEIDNKIKYAACEIADMYYENAMYSNISSENNDGYSVSIDKRYSVNRKAYFIACRYLANTGLLYRGIGNE